MENAVLTVNGKKIEVKKGSLLSDALSQEKPCGGKGSCGKCKVTAHGDLSPLSAAEVRLLTKEELVSGIRLACLTHILGDCEITIDGAGKDVILTDGSLGKLPLAPRFEKYGAALDIGTTTLAARLFDKKGNLLSEASAVNPQGKWGADVISRIEADLSGKGEALSRAVKDAIEKLLLSLAKDAEIHTKDVDGLVITGNTVMLHLLTGTSTEPLSHAPFAAKERFGKTAAAKELGLSVLSENTKIYLPPCISAFLGADTVCAMLASGLLDAKDPTLLVDIGTNGEIVLNDHGKLTACSAAAGPAFEGVGISSGMRGQVGAIDAVSLVNGRFTPHVIGGAKAKGICGSGIVDAIACLLAIEELDSSGYLEAPAHLADGVTLTQEDIRSVQLAKSAICAGLETLLASQKLTVGDLSRLFVAGGFGSFLNLKSAERIGLLPKGTAQKSAAVGNSALAGAAMLLLDKFLADIAARLADTTTPLDLATNQTFFEKYTEGMLFPHPHP